MCLIARMYLTYILYHSIFVQVDRFPKLGGICYATAQRSRSSRFTRYSKGIFTGKHSHDNAFLFVNKKNAMDVIPEHPSVYDVMDIIEQLNGENK